MDKLMLAELEQATEPYRRRGFIVTSQSEGAITMSPPPPRFSYLLFFLALIVFWPAAVIYLVYFNTLKNKQVCVRVTSEGHIEETGYTLEAMEEERRRGRWLLLLLFVGAPALLVMALLLAGFRLW